MSDGIRGREILCDFGVHNARHCFGVLDNLNFLSLEAFVKDCDAQRQYPGNREAPSGFKPLHFPADPQSFEVIQRVASFDYHADYHTTANLSVFDDWVLDLKARGLLPEN